MFDERGINPLTDPRVQATSYFFREPSSLDTIVESLIPLLRRNDIRVASVGCSSGQEVYSLHMVHEDAGLGGTLHVDGYDYRDEHLSLARRAVYKGFLYSALGYRNALGAKLEAISTRRNVEFVIPSRFVDRSTFVQHDIVCHPLPQQYPIILCANVLYHYFAHPELGDMSDVLNNLADSLEDEGYLVCEDEGGYQGPQAHIYPVLLANHPRFVARPDLVIPVEGEGNAMVFQKKAA